MIDFNIDPVVFSDFYKSKCGRITNKIISQHILSLWPDIKDMNILVLGWGFPYLHHFDNKKNRLISAVPHYKLNNIKKMPKHNQNTVALVNINNLPFNNHTFDRILVVHGAEYSTDIIDFLDNVERLLTSDGRIITIMPNKSGLWRRKGDTPFKYGAAITANQLQWSLKHVGFDVDYYSAALVFPPTQSHYMLSLSMKWEGIGRNILPFLSGIHIVEGHKNLYAGAILKPESKKFALSKPKLRTVADCN